MGKDRAILHVSDWHLQDRWYDVSRDLLVEFRTRILRDGMRAAWDWFIDESNAQRCDDCVDHTLPEFFLDYAYPEESANEWELS